MTARDAFKIGFLARCVQDGMTGPEAAAIAQKAAAFLERRANLATWAGDKATGTLDLAGNVAAGLGIAAPIAAGAGLGYLAHRAAQPEVDADDIRKRELIDEYTHYIRRARERQRARTLLPAA